MAVSHCVDVGRWKSLFRELMDRVAVRFERVETRRTARKMVSGLVSELPTKNCWTLAEAAGEETPDAMQHFLARAVWDEDAVRDDLRAPTASSIFRSPGPKTLLAVLLRESPTM